MALMVMLSAWVPAQNGAATPSKGGKEGIVGTGVSRHPVGTGVIRRPVGTSVSRCPVGTGVSRRPEANC